MGWGGAGEVEATHGGRDHEEEAARGERDWALAVSEMGAFTSHLNPLKLQPTSQKPHTLKQMP